MSDYEPVIGLEIHVQLKTRTKMFCGCALSFGEEPNTLTCPVCLGHPGTLPTLNAQAVHFGLMIAEAFGCEVAERSVFARKNYFYPDLPKGYQISQYDLPLAVRGEIGGVRIHRVHLEEDAAKLVHVGESGRIHGSGASLVDFNRGGTPLVEIVTEPDLRSAEQARDWLRRLRITLEQLGVSDVNMEEGSLRCDANVSLRPVGSEELGTKTELKNMNSFRFLEHGVQAELARQEELLQQGREIEQETFHYDPVSGGLTPLRSKEEAHDYRYFPEPDLVPLAPTDEMLERARQALPELPLERQGRLERDFGLSAEQAEVLASTRALGDFYERAATDGADPKKVADWVTGELVARLREEGLDDVAEAKLTPEALGKLVAMIDAKAVSHGSAKEVLAVLVREGGEPEAVVEAKGLAQISDEGELEQAVRGAIEANPDVVEQLRAGKEKAIGRLVGAVMKETQGRADGGRVTELIRAQLGL